MASGLAEAKLHVAPMGVDLANRFVPGSDDDRLGVLYVGRLVANKGVGDLIGAWAATTGHVRDQGLTVIGDGDQKQALQEMAASLGVSDSVTFLGSVSHQELPAYYKQAALLVFPSTDQEGLGLVAIEAMGCNCAVLTSDIGSLSDVVIEGQTGFVYPLGDTTALAKRLEEIVSSAERSRQIAAHGGEAVRARFDWSVIGHRYHILYSRLVPTSESANP
jgi:phosphatidylinositol alpha-1,6-mannosyltransferase